MDAKAVSAASGVEVGTLNAWISRGYVPGITPDAQGRRRDFDIKTATHVAVMAALVRFGFGAPMASKGATAVGLLSPSPFRFIARLYGGEPDQKATLEFGSADTAEELTSLIEEKGYDVYLMVNVPRILKKMQRAEADWRESRKGAQD